MAKIGVDIRSKSKGRKSGLEQWIEDVAYPLTTAEAQSIGRMGVAALRANTPQDTGNLASSWAFDVYDRIVKNGVQQIVWRNGVRVGTSSVPLAVLKQLGHATRDGGWVQGIDYINPAMKGVSSSALNITTSAVRRK